MVYFNRTIKIPNPLRKRSEVFARRRHTGMYNSKDTAQALFVGERYFKEAEGTKDLKLRLKRYIGAIVNFSQVLQYDLNNSDLLLKVGKLYMRKGWTEFAMTFLPRYSADPEVKDLIVGWKEDNRCGSDLCKKAWDLIEMDPILKNQFSQKPLKAP